MSKAKQLKNPVFNGKIQPEHRVVFAFESGGINNFKFDDTMNIPCGRSFKALSYYEEVNMRCTREYLQGVFTAQKNICKSIVDHLKSKEVNIIDIFNKLMELEKFSDQTLERLDYIVDYEAILKLASVIYFDETENPYDYDFKYGAKKIALWKKEKPDDFFLSQPIQKLMPQINLSKTDLDIYRTMMNQMTKTQIEVILSHLSAHDKTKDFYNILKLQMPTT